MTAALLSGRLRSRGETPAPGFTAAFGKPDPKTISRYATEIDRVAGAHATDGGTGDAITIIRCGCANRGYTNLFAHPVVQTEWLTLSLHNRKIEACS